MLGISDGCVVRVFSEVSIVQSQKNIVSTVYWLILCVALDKLCRSGLSQDTWNDVKKQLREITKSTQVTNANCYQLILEKQNNSSTHDQT